MIGYAGEALRTVRAAESRSTWVVLGIEMSLLKRRQPWRRVYHSRRFHASLALKMRKQSEVAVRFKHDSLTPLVGRSALPSVKAEVYTRHAREVSISDKVTLFVWLALSNP